MSWRDWSNRRYWITLLLFLIVGVFISRFAHRRILEYCIHRWMEAACEGSVEEQSIALENLERHITNPSAKQFLVSHWRVGLESGHRKLRSDTVEKLVRYRGIPEVYAILLDNAALIIRSSVTGAGEIQYAIPYGIPSTLREAAWTALFSRKMIFYCNRFRVLSGIYEEQCIVFVNDGIELPNHSARYWGAVAIRDRAGDLNPIYVQRVSTKFEGYDWVEAVLSELDRNQLSEAFVSHSGWNEESLIGTLLKDAKKTLGELHSETR